MVDILTKAAALRMWVPKQQHPCCLNKGACSSQPSMQEELDQCRLHKLSWRSDAQSLVPYLQILKGEVDSMVNSPFLFFSLKLFITEIQMHSAEAVTSVRILVCAKILKSLPGQKYILENQLSIHCDISCEFVWLLLLLEL